MSKLNQHAQDFQGTYMITKHLFLPVTQSKQNDVSFWMMKIFRHCQTWKDLILFCNNILSLVPNDGDLSLCGGLLKDHPDSIKDQVAHLADARAHQERYGQDLQRMLTENFQRRTKRNNDTKPSMERSILMMRACVRDQSYNYLGDEDKQRYQSLTWKRGRGKAGNSKRKVVIGKFMSLCDCLSVVCVACLCPDICVCCLLPHISLLRVSEYSSTQEAISTKGGG